MTLTYRDILFSVKWLLLLLAVQTSSAEVADLDIEEMQLTTADLPRGFYLDSKDVITEDKTTGKRVEKKWVHEDRVDRLSMPTAVRASIKQRTEGEIQEGQAKLKLTRTLEGQDVSNGECLESIWKIWLRTRVTAEGRPIPDTVHVRIVTAHPGQDPQEALRGRMPLAVRLKRLEQPIVGEITIVPAGSSRDWMWFIRGNVAVSISAYDRDIGRAGNERFCVELAKKVDARIIKALKRK